MIDPSSRPTDEEIRRAPKVLLHDHLDGGLRPGTVLELADDVGYRHLPADEPDTLQTWFRDAADSGELERYLETFAHTVALLQSEEALRRVAHECVLDCAADGVVYAEIRYAPELFTEHGLTLEQIVEAVQDGFEQGMVDAARQGRFIRVGTLLCAMRQNARSLEIAELAVRYRDHGVVGFDIAGPEDGFPPTRNLDAFEYLRQQNSHFTIHAGEAFGLPSIWEAIQHCGAERLGHGVRLTDDIKVDDNGEAHLGRLASYVRDCRIPLEMCPSSNVQTGAVPSIEQHPVKLLSDLRFRVTINTDNRLMSQCSMTSEMKRLVDAFGYTLADMQWFTINAMKSAFISFDERLDIINEQIKPGYAALTWHGA